MTEVRVPLTDEDQRALDAFLARCRDTFHPVGEETTTYRAVTGEPYFSYYGFNDKAAPSQVSNILPLVDPSLILHDSADLALEALWTRLSEDFMKAGGKRVVYWRQWPDLSCYQDDHTGRKYVSYARVLFSSTPRSLP